MARLSPSSNNSFPTADSPRRQQQQQDDDDNNNDDYEHDVPGQRISSPDYVEVEIPQSIGAAPSQQSPVSSTSSEGYPSWLPKRPPPPAPGSTLHSLSTAMMFGADGPAEQHPGGGGAGAGPASASEDRQQQTPVPFSGGRKPTPRSVRIVSMQDSNAATSAGGTGGAGGAGGRRREQQGTDRTTTTRVSSSADVTPPRPSSSFFCSLVWGSRAAKASAIGALSPTLFSSSQTPDARLRAAIVTPPKFRSP